MAPANFIWRKFEWQVQGQTYRLEVGKDGSHARFTSQGRQAAGDNQTGDVQFLDMPMAAWVALSDAVRQTRMQEQRSGLPARAGKSWSQVECQTVVKAFKNGLSIGEIAKQQNRTEGAIISRLAQLGMIDRETFKHPAPNALSDGMVDADSIRHH